MMSWLKIEFSERKWRFPGIGTIPGLMRRKQVAQTMTRSEMCTSERQGHWLARTLLAPVRMHCKHITSNDNNANHYGEIYDFNGSGRH